MIYQRELSFLTEVFEGCHIPITVTEKENISVPFEKEDIFGADGVLLEFVASAKPNTLYKITDGFDRSYRMLLLPNTLTPTVLLVGPYLPRKISEERIFEIEESYGIPPQTHRYINEYYLSVPVIKEDSHIFVLLNVFCERIWQNPAFSIEEFSSGNKGEKDETAFPKQNLDDTMLDIKTVERRYAFENEIINAVRRGQVHMENTLRAAFSENLFEKRTRDPLRNAKNYLVIMNTLLRKGAEDGGVHPIHLDRASSKFAIRIENMITLSETTNLMCEMFRTYCRLVRNHSLKEYSPIVQKTVIIIGDDLSADLTPGSLAKTQDLSLGYLSATFKREVGKTLSEYIRGKRVEYAKFLLETTTLQVQTVALKCGVVDVQHFTKIFKKETGKTPSEYRAASKNAHKA